MPTLRIPRRAALHLGISALTAPTASVAAPTSPQQGDRLILAADKRSETIITPAALTEGAPPTLAWAMDPNLRFIRNQSRFDLILLLRLQTPNPREAQTPASGIVAYSAICTHAGCTVSGWKPQEQHLLCPCHGSVYDPASAGRVLAGPAPRPLPSLPLRSDDRTLTVAAGFTDRIGGNTGRTE
jgi:rieske iron-sulfur protein